MIKKAAFYFIFLIVSVVHFMVTFVVILFVLSTLNIFNRNIIHLPGLHMIEIIVMVLIGLVSLFMYFRSLHKISRMIKDILFRPPL